jgi:hypothetical protein
MPMLRDGLSGLLNMRERTDPHPEERRRRVSKGGGACPVER